MTCTLNAREGGREGRREGGREGRRRESEGPQIRSESMMKGPVWRALVVREVGGREGGREGRRDWRNRACVCKLKKTRLIPSFVGREKGRERGREGGSLSRKLGKIIVGEMG